MNYQEVTDDPFAMGSIEIEVSAGGEKLRTQAWNVRLACCDCGLVHDIIVFEYNKQMMMLVERKDKSTGQIRRHMKRKKEGIFV